MHYTYKTKGTCSQRIEIDVRDDVIADLEFSDGCSGNLQGLSALLKGMKVDEVIDKLAGIQCRNGTSCPDQLSRALAQMKAARSGS